MANQKDRAESNASGSGSGGGGGPKPQFKVNEKVLCYEPDIKKAQVLYESKVLEVVRKQDSTDAYYEYKIHFQGWKCTWDRYVREDNVLKNTEENRNLQRKLREKVDEEKALQKKKKKKISIKEKIQAVQAFTPNTKEIKTKGKVSRTNQETAKGLTDYDSSEEEGELVCQSEQLVIPEELKKILEYDRRKVKSRKWLVKLPCEINVIELLEEYIGYVGRLELRSYILKIRNLKSRRNKRNGGFFSKIKPRNLSGQTRNNIANEELIKTMQRITYTKKVVEDVRIMFDFLLPQILLYRTEVDQYNEYLNGAFSGVTPQPSPISAPIIEPPKPMEDDSDDLIIQNVIKKNMPPPPVPPLKRRTRSAGNVVSINQDLDLGNKARQTRKSTSGLPLTAEVPVINLDPTIPLEMIPLSQIKTEPVDDVEEEPVLKRRKVNTNSIVAVSPKSSEENHSASSKSVHALPVRKSPSARNNNGPIPLRYRTDKFGCELEEKCDFAFACQHLNKFMDELFRYELLPESERYGEDPHPSICYGMHHLLRLFVKTPEVLSRTTIPRRKMGSIVKEMNSILLYFTTIKGVVTKDDWHNPRVTLYEEDYINEANCHLVGTGTPIRKLLKKAKKGIEKEKFRSSIKAVNGSKSSRICLMPSGKGKKSKKDKRQIMSAMEENKFAIGNRQLDGQVKRNSRRLSGKPESVTSSGASIAMGVRKSLTQEELSRETLVAAHITPPAAVAQSPTKKYSFRHHSRPSYK